MAGIVVSGGTYSGSGDVTTDWVKIMNVADGWFIAPDGNLTLVGNTGGYSMQTALPTGASAGFHSNGGTVVFAADGTNPMINVDGFNGMGHFYNVQSTLAATRYHTRIKATGNLTIDAGATFESSRAAYGANNTYVDFEGDLYVAGTYNAEGLDTGDVGDAFGSANIVGGGTFKACSGNTTMNYKSGLYSVIFRNNGTMIHNSGTLILNTNTDAVYGGGGGTGGPWNVIVTERGAGTYTYRTYSTPIIENNLTISGAVVYNNNLAGGQNHTVSGAVVIVSGASYANTGAAANTQTFGSLELKAGAGTTFIASPSGTVNITSRDSGGYGWKRNAAATFTPNDSTVLFSYTDNSVYVVEDTFYNLTVDLPHASYNELRYSDVDGNGLRVNNDFLINDGHFKFDTAADDLLVSGNLLVSGGSTFGITNTPTGDHTIGTLDIKSTATYNATTGTTKLFGKTGVTYTQAGTFTHNDGLFWVSGGTQQMKWGDTLHGPFYDLKSSGVGNEMRGKALKIENSFIITDGYVVPSYNGGTGKVWTLGTDSSSAYISGTASDPLWVHDSNPPYHFVIQASSSVYPAELKGYEWKWSGYGTAQSIKFGGVDCQFDINTANGGSVANQFEVIDQCDFTSVTVDPTSIFTATNQYVGFSDDLFVDGILSATGSLLVVDDKLKTNSTSTINNNGTAAIIGHGGTSTVRFNRGTWDTVMFRNTGEVQFDTNTNTAVNFIAAGGIVNTAGMHFNGDISNTIIANGGTLTRPAGGIFKTTDFSNRGGLFASSSAVDLTATTQSVLIPTSADFDDNPFDGGGTMEWWVNLDADGVGVERGDLFSMWTTQLRAYFLDQSGDTCKIRFVQKFSGDNPEWETGQSIPIGKWVHIAITYDNDDPANDPLLYIDGKLTYFPNNTPAGGTRTAVGGYPLYLGNDSSGNDTMDGRIGMFRYFKTTIRTPAQIRADMFNQYSDMESTTGLKCMLQFDESEGTTVTDVSTQSNNATLENSLGWTTGGTWTAGGVLGDVTEVIAGNLYIGNGGTAATVFASSYFNIDNYKLISGSKFASKSHMGTDFYYVATSGASDYLNYSALAGAPILTANDLHILANSYFNFDTSANNNQCDEITNYAGSTVRIVAHADFYTQDFDNQGTWLRNATYDGIIHDDGSTPHEYEPIDIMDDQDSPFDAEDLID